MMAKTVLVTTLAALFVVPGALQAQGDQHAKIGPIIEGFGAVYEIPEPEFPTPTEVIYRAVFDVAISSDESGQRNQRIETLARFLNMHAQAGVPLEKMHLALVAHGAAGKDLLADEAYRKRFGVANPNLPLIRALAERGVRIILCGQTAAYRGLAAEELAPEVDVALSAMTALVRLQQDGYALIAF